MLGKQSKATKSLQIEILESRDLLAGTDPASGLAVLPANPQGSSALSGGGFPAEVSALAAASAFGFPTPGPGFVATPGSAIVLVGVDTNAAPTTGAPLANTGVGRMTLTTGANTPGIGSFATSTLGYASENGGRSNG